mgnify:CR=1 FL=1
MTPSCAGLRLLPCLLLYSSRTLGKPVTPPPSVSARYEAEASSAPLPTHQLQCWTQAVDRSCRSGNGLDSLLQLHEGSRSCVVRVRIYICIYIYEVHIPSNPLSVSRRRVILPWDPRARLMRNPRHNTALSTQQYIYSSACNSTCYPSQVNQVRSIQRVLKKRERRFSPSRGQEGVRRGLHL